MWSDKYKIDKCNKCGTSKNKHEAFGLCKSCYFKQYSSIPIVKNRLQQTGKQRYINPAKREQRRKYREENAERIKFQSKVYRENKYFGGMRVPCLVAYNYTCAVCGFKGNDTTLDVHHIDHQGSNTKNPNNRLDNLLPLCYSCHASEHHRKTKWAKNYDNCVICGKTDRKHVSHGNCKLCQSRIDRQNKKQQNKI